MPTNLIESRLRPQTNVRACLERRKICQTAHPPSKLEKSMEFVSIDLWAANLEPVVPDLQVWLAALEMRVAQTVARGGHMLVLPEFACAQWLSFAPADMAEADTLEWLFECGEVALDAIAAMSAKHGVSILAGTIPFLTEPVDGVPTYFNRAWLITPDGQRHSQDKLSLTPLEAQGAGGITVHGESINVFNWNGLRVAMIICLDSEFTDLWSRLGTLDLDLVIIPAKTDMITGYNRVFSCARARAIELQTVVCVLGAVGVPFGFALTDTGVGGASVFLPCDVGVSLDGIHGAIAPQTAAMMTDHVLAAVDIPVGACRRLRNGHAEAEVCPALWDAGHLIVNDPASP
ncbi:nitrilase-related carbon-nitrogen hydrolase [Oceaniglobus ichthyenteri]|uniref:nitrilase-related carbon-nitrogen hydrolase n=1 Tax=Oceaniglobus ichthyenteri TaxID=2136177 RepID=UPI000D353ECD|nr:nitrilase-related carbon-nitrogen hydrolase [Oceaniglobus ichthyenteri]